MNLTDTNTMLIWIGQNDPAKYDGPGWKLQMENLTARYKTARPDMQFILVSSYDTGNSRLADYSQDLYEISQDDSSVLFLNLYQQAGPFSSIDGNYLSDHVHPNLAGDVYFPTQLEGLIETPARMSELPEPNAVMGGAGRICGHVDASTAAETGMRGSRRGGCGWTGRMMVHRRGCGWCVR